jgi:hypothetical protein
MESPYEEIDDEAADETLYPLDDDGEAAAEDPDQEALRPLIEAGQGEAEGFELAERELIAHASHEHPSPDPTRLAGKPEPQRSDAEYGEPDELESTEVTDE